MATQEEQDKITLIAMLGKLTDVVVGEPNELNLDEPTLPEIVYAVQRSEKVLLKDFEMFMKHKKTACSVLDEMEIVMKRRLELGKYIKN
jgi:hypothetical protein